MKTLQSKLTYLFLFFAVAVYGQEKKVNKENQQWIQYYNQLKLGDKWSLFTDGGFRWKNSFNDNSQYIVRVAGNYKINKEMNAGFGFANLGFYDANKKINKVEFRPYEEFAILNSYDKFSIQHRFRVEERYFYAVVKGKIQSDREFNFRFRYRLLFNIPVFKLSSADTNKKVSLSLGNEIFINAGQEIVNTIFDQNRLLLGSIVQVDKNISVSLTYNNQFASTKTAGTYNQANVIWLGITQKIDASKPK